MTNDRRIAVALNHLFLSCMLVSRLERDLRPLATLFLCFVLAFAAPSFGQVSWNFLGPVVAPDRIVAVAVDPSNDSVLYLASPGSGVWKTVDAGGTRSPLLDSSGIWQVCSLAIDPRFPQVLYAGTGDDQSPKPGQGVGRSADGGQTWVFQTRFTNKPVCALAVDPTNSSKVLAGSAEGLFLSS